MADFSKREVIAAPLMGAAGLAAGLAGTGLSARSSAAVQAVPQIPKGRFDASVASLETYRAPD